MDIRNNNFAAAVDYLKRNGKIKTQKQLAGMMKVSEDTITRILKGKHVSEDVISKLQAATDCIFNLQWLRGESDVMMAAPIRTEDEQRRTYQQVPTSDADFSSWVNAIIAAKDDAIVALKREGAAKDETIAALHGRLADKDALIQTLQQQVSDYRHLLSYVQSKTVSESYQPPLAQLNMVRCSRTS